MKFYGTPDAIIDEVNAQYPGINDVLVAARPIWHQKAVEEYQAAALYALARASGAERVLEIGTARGYSATILGLALPNAEIITLNPNAAEAAVAKRNLWGLDNVDVLELHSWEYFRAEGTAFDLIFVDGDHKRVRRDLEWWGRLSVGGMMVFHDYTPERPGQRRACPPVYEALNEVAARLGRGFDFEVVDSVEGLGMVGVGKRSEAETIA